MTKLSRFSSAAKFIFILLSILVSSCAQVEQATPTPTTPTPLGKALAWEKIIENWGANADYMYWERTPDIVVVADKASVALLQTRLEPSKLDLVAQVDLSSFFVVIIYQGNKGSTEYSVEVTDVRQESENRLITLYALFHEPAPGQVVGDAITSPYYILKVKKTEGLRGEFTFVLNANGIEVARQIQNIP